MRYLLIALGVIVTSTCLQGCSNQQPEPPKQMGDIFDHDRDDDRDHDRDYNNRHEHDRRDRDDNGW